MTVPGIWRGIAFSLPRSRSGWVIKEEGSTRSRFAMPSPLLDDGKWRSLSGAKTGAIAGKGNVREHPECLVGRAAGPKAPTAERQRPGGGPTR